MIYTDFIEGPGFDELVALLQANYRDVTFGQQGDAGIWIENRGMKVEIDTMTTTHFQVKSPSQKRFLVFEILKLLADHYKLDIYPKPEPGHL